MKEEIPTHKYCETTDHLKAPVSQTGVSIGMPVYNGAATIRCALESILSQSHVEFELIISDNASTDETETICRGFAQHDSRIRYHRQTRNMGAVANFQYVLDQARQPFFMWAAADDVRSGDFIRSNLLFLMRNPDFVASTTPVRFEDGRFDEHRMGDGSLVGPKQQRICRFFLRWHANGRFYSLMRRDVIKDCPFVKTSFLGSDWAVVLYLASHGKLNRLDNGWLCLGARGVSRTQNIFRIYRRGFLDFLLPFATLTQLALGMGRQFRPMDRVLLFARLARLNLMAFLVQLVFIWRR